MLGICWGWTRPCISPWPHFHRCSLSHNESIGKPLRRQPRCSTPFVCLAARATSANGARRSLRETASESPRSPQRSSCKLDAVVRGVCMAEEAGIHHLPRRDFLRASLLVGGSLAGMSVAARGSEAEDPSHLAGQVKETDERGFTLQFHSGPAKGHPAAGLRNATSLGGLAQKIGSPKWHSPWSRLYDTDRIMAMVRRPGGIVALRRPCFFRLHLRCV